MIKLSDRGRLIGVIVTVAVVTAPGRILLAMAIAAISMSVSTTSKIASHRRVRLGERPGPPLPPPGPPVPLPVGGVPPPLAVRTADAAPAPAAAPPSAD